MARNVTNPAAIATEKDTRPAPELGGVQMFDLPPAANAVLNGALEREQWLQAIGLRGIVTGIAHYDMREFSLACSRLVTLFKNARATGYLEGHNACAVAASRRWRAIAGACAGLGCLVGLILGSLLG